jgi:DNA invertase Pin-like site-specific DNA recombinase
MSRKNKAYLYSRVSSKEQLDGKGLERQIANAIKFLDKECEYELAEDYSIIDNKSAYTGANIKEDAGLGKFIASAKSGGIPPDSLLLIEAPDRLTRLGIRKGQALFNELADLKINIGLVRFGVIVKHDEDNDFTSSLIVSVGLYLAKLESEQKSYRIKETFKLRNNDAREGKDTPKKKPPFWLTVSDKKNKFIINEHWKKIINDIFDLRINSKPIYGVVKLTRVLNEKAILNNKEQPWNKRQVRDLLRNKKLIGEYQPKRVTKGEDGNRIDVNLGSVISSYFPIIVEEDKFYLAQGTFTNKDKGRTGQYKNLLRGIAKCPLCKGGMSYHFTSGIDYLKCTNKLNDSRACSHKSVPFTLGVDKVVELLKFLDYSKIQSDTNVNNEKLQDIKTLEGKKSDLEKQIRDNAKLFINYQEGHLKSALFSELEKLEDKLNSVIKDINHKKATLKIHSNTEAQRLVKDAQIETPEQRQLFNQYLQEFIEYIELDREYFIIKFQNKNHPIYVDPKIDINSLLEKIYESETSNAFTSVFEEIFGQNELTTLATKQKFKNGTSGVATRK